MNDTYLTIKSPSEGIFKEKGSKFLAFAYPISAVEEIKALIDQKRKEYHDARHVCYAYMLGNERLTFRANDDGEPSGTAGKPILGQINSNQLTNILIIVVRYFGGILLGTNGLITAYKTAAKEAISAATIETRLVENRHAIEFEYAVLNEVMRIVKEFNLNIVDQHQTEKCQLTFSVRQSQEETVLQRLNKLTQIVFL